MSESYDWSAIRADYESGQLSLQQLATKYNVPKTTIHRRSAKWNGTERNGKSGTEERNDVERIRVLRSELPSIPGAVVGAGLGIEALVEYLKKNAKAMDLVDHVKAATALSQYNRIIVNAVSDEDEEEEDAEIITIDTRELSGEQLARLKTFALEMKESEQEGNKQVG